MAFFCIRKLLGLLKLSNIIWILATITTVRGRRLPGLRFTTEPKDTAAVVGSTVELKCDAVFGFNVEPELSWVFNGSKVVLSNLVLSKTLDYNFSQKKRGNLRIENISDEAYGVYQCVAMASTGSIISRKARVRKSYLRMIPNQSSKRIVCSGSHPCILKPPDVVSFPEPSFAWKFRRHANESFIKIENSHDRSAEFVVSLDGVLVILEVNQSRRGEYNCTVTNEVETVDVVYDVVVDGTNKTNKHPRLSILIKPQNITVVASSSASFGCISSEKNAQVKWLKGKTPIGPGEKFDIPSPHRLTVKMVSLKDEGWYTCIISNISQKAYLDVRGAVKLTGFPHRKEVLWNEILILKSTANDGEIEWYFNAQPIHSINGRRSSNAYNITRQTTRNGNEIVTDKQTLRVRGISKNQSGIYQVLANGFQSQDLKHTEVTFYDCGGKLTTDYGSISSPNSSEPHLSDSECVWVIKPERKRTNSILYLEILHFDGDEACLEIRNGETVDSSIISYSTQTPISSGLHGVFAFRLLFKFRASGKRCYGFNATYWVKEPTTPSITESTSQPTEPQTSETETAFTTKAISKIITVLETTRTEASKRTPTKRISTKETHTTEKESEAGNVEKSSLKNNTVVYAVVAVFGVIFLLLALVLIMRKGYFFLSCIKGNTRENKRGAERQANAVNEYASPCEISLYDIPSEHDSLNCQSNSDGPVYDVLEGPGDKQNTDQSQNVYASVNDGCVEEEDPVDPISRSGNFEVSFLEEIYSTLAEDRGNDAGNIYESLRRDQNENEKNDGWSVEGMKSCDQDYVSVVNE